MRFYIDDNEVYTFSPEIKTEAVCPFDQPFYLILNTAVGGTFAGTEVDDSIFPQEFKIDYIKITQDLNSCGAYIHSSIFKWKRVQSYNLKHLFVSPLF